MHILAFILMFIFGSIAYAFKGDYSGLVAIGKFIGFIALFFIMAFIMMNPALLIIVAVVVVIALIACCSK